MQEARRRRRPSRFARRPIISTSRRPATTRAPSSRRWRSGSASPPTRSRPSATCRTTCAMFAKSGISFAMGNATDDVKKQRDACDRQQRARRLCRRDGDRAQARLKHDEIRLARGVGPFSGAISTLHGVVFAFFMFGPSCPVPPAMRHRILKPVRRKNRGIRKVFFPRTLLYGGWPGFTFTICVNPRLARAGIRRRPPPEMAGFPSPSLPRRRVPARATHFPADRDGVEAGIWPPRLGATDRPSLRPLHRRLLGRRLRRAEIMRGVDQRDMRQRLRKIAGLAAGHGVVLLGQ